MFIKLHKSYKTVVAICDNDLIGKKFFEDIKQLDVRENFYKEKEVNEEEVIRIIQRQAIEDSTFNIVGEQSTNAAVKAGLIKKEDIGNIAGIPIVLTI